MRWGFNHRPTMYAAWSPRSRCPVEGNKLLQEVVAHINRDVEIRTMWRASNITAIERLGFNDHGPTHVKIVARLALKMLRLLSRRGTSRTS